MATLREIRRRIRSVKSLGQVTRAMEAVAASKMRRAQERSVASRAYADRAWEVLTYLASEPRGKTLHPLLEARPVKRVGLILITPDRGLAGGLPSGLIRQATRFIRKHTDEGREVEVIAVGRKGRNFMLLYGGGVYAEFAHLSDLPPLTEITPIARLAIDDFLAGTFDQVWITYADFVSTMVQRPVTRLLLPIEPAVEERMTATYTIEPDPDTVLWPVLGGFTVLQIYQAVLEAQASEHSARMVAMRNATENAEELQEDMTLTYNKARQEAITKEILDIAGGAEAMVGARR